jgi:hypothetical protein
MDEAFIGVVYRLKTDVPKCIGHIVFKHLRWLLL